MGWNCLAKQRAKNEGTRRRTDKNACKPGRTQKLGPILKNTMTTFRVESWNSCANLRSGEFPPRRLIPRLSNPSQPLHPPDRVFVDWRRPSPTLLRGQVKLAPSRHAAPLCRIPEVHNSCRIHFPNRISLLWPTYRNGQQLSDLDSAHIFLSVCEFGRISAR